MLWPFRHAGAGTHSSCCFLLLVLVRRKHASANGGGESSDAIHERKRVFASGKSIGRVLLLPRVRASKAILRNMIDISTHPAAPFALGIVLALAGRRTCVPHDFRGRARRLSRLDGFAGVDRIGEVAGGAGCLRRALALVEFLTDKLPGVDSVWDLVHTWSDPRGRFSAASRCPPMAARPASPAWFSAAPLRL